MSVFAYRTQSSKGKDILQKTWDEFWDFSEKVREDNMVIIGGDINFTLGKPFRLRENKFSRSEAIIS